MNFWIKGICNKARKIIGNPVSRSVDLWELKPDRPIQSKKASFWDALIYYFIVVFSYFSQTKALAPRMAASASSSSLKTNFTLFLKIGRRFLSI